MTRNKTGNVLLRKTAESDSVDSAKKSTFNLYFFLT